MEDVAPELYSEIQKLYTQAVRSDSKIMGIVRRVKEGKGTQSDLRVMSERLGKHASDALKQVLKVDRLPDGKMYWNIAEKTIKPTLEQMHSTVNAVASLEKRAEDVKHGIKLALKTGGDPSWRINEVMNFAANSVTQTELTNALTEPVKTAVLAFLDDFEKVNAKTRADAGIKQYVIREYDGVGLDHNRTCNWCVERAGTWTYEDAEANGVFERHPGCGCTIEVLYEDGFAAIQKDWHHNEWDYGYTDL
jgi:hypothetical protein